jgi:flagellar biosynthesis/type III secretory pathway protein FliH
MIFTVEFPDGISVRTSGVNEHAYLRKSEGWTKDMVDGLLQAVETAVGSYQQGYEEGFAEAESQDDDPDELYQEGYDEGFLEGYDKAKREYAPVPSAAA